MNRERELGVELSRYQANAREEKRRLT